MSSRSRTSSCSSFELVEQHKTEHPEHQHAELSKEQLKMLQEAQAEVVSSSDEELRMEKPKKVGDLAEDFRAMKAKFVQTQRHRNRLHKQLGLERKRAEQEMAALLEKVAEEKMVLEERVKEVEAEKEQCVEELTKEKELLKEARTAAFLKELAGEWRLLTMKEHNAHLQKHRHPLGYRIKALLATNNYQIDNATHITTWGALFRCTRFNEDRLVIGCMERPYDGGAIKMVTGMDGEKLVTTIKERNVRTERWIENERLHIVHSDAGDVSTRVFEKVTRKVQLLNSLWILGRALVQPTRPPPPRH